MSAALTLELAPQRERAGCKGPAAEAWLAERGISPPGGANQYQIDFTGVLVARLATSEFLLEGMNVTGDRVLKPVRDALEGANCPRGVYPVPREDLVMEMGGHSIQNLFLETCAVDLERVARHSSATRGPVIMTSMIGVSVVLVCRQLALGPHFILWCDPSYGTYLRTQLSVIAADLAVAGGTHS